MMGDRFMPNDREHQQFRHDVYALLGLDDDPAIDVREVVDLRELLDIRPQPVHAG